MKGKQLVCNFYLCHFSHRYALRTLLIPFALPQVGPTTQEIAKNFELLNHHLEKASSMAGLVVSLQKTLVDKGFTKIMNKLNKKVLSIMGYSKPRLSLGYCIYNKGMFIKAVITLK